MAEKSSLIGVKAMPEYHVGIGLAGIYAGTLDKSKTMWINKSDVTKESIYAVFMWFRDHMVQYNGNEEHEYSVSYPSQEYELVMRRKRGKTNA